MPAWMQLPGGCSSVYTGVVCSPGALMFHIEVSSSAAGLAGRDIQGSFPKPFNSSDPGTVEPGSSLGCADAAPWSGNRCLFSPES